jgi:hypothetical protein
MKYMGWSQADLRAADDSIVAEVVAMIQEQVRVRGH